MTYGLEFIAIWCYYSHATFSLCEHTVLHVIILKKKKKKKKNKRRNKMAEKRGSGEM
jgi:hypothetical protein